MADTSYSSCLLTSYLPPFPFPSPSSLPPSCLSLPPLPSSLPPSSLPPSCLSLPPLPTSLPPLPTSFPPYLLPSSPSSPMSELVMKAEGLTQTCRVCVHAVQLVPNWSFRKCEHFEIVSLLPDALPSRVHFPVKVLCVTTAVRCAHMPVARQCRGCR